MGAISKNRAGGPITVLGLKALTAADEGSSVNFGESMSGKVHVGRDGTVSVHASWRYRFQGKTREMRIGTWRDKGGITLKALRDERDRLANMVRNGEDPIAQKALVRMQQQAELANSERQMREQAQAEQAAELALQRRLTLRQLFDRWCEIQLQPRIRADGKRSGRVDGGAFVRRQFERHVFPSLGHVAAADIRKSDLLALLDAQLAKDQLRTANMLLSDLKQMLDFALERDLIVVNPLATVKKSKIGGAAVERDRVLSEEEVMALGPAVAQARMSPRSAAAIWLTLATGVRVGELMGVVWNDALPKEAPLRATRLQALQELALEQDVKVGFVDMDTRTWYLPTTKNQRDHTIALSDFAVRQFERLRALREVLVDSATGELSPWVFPASDSRKPVCVKSLGKQLADRQREPGDRLSRRSKATQALALGGGKWTAHDLRRTAATAMAQMGVATEVINECLNHVQKDRMAKVYIRDRREKEQAVAFAKLGEWLDGRCKEPV